MTWESEVRPGAEKLQHAMLQTRLIHKSQGEFHHLNQQPHWIDDGESKVNYNLLWPNISGE